MTPDVATMNRAHATHYSAAPDPGIRFVLRGWDAPGKAAHHNLQVGDVRIRNVPTNIRDEDGGTRLYGNSMFVFETAGLCIVHLGHLHHPLEPEQLKALGRMDVVLVPVDGTWTLNVYDMMGVLSALNAPLAVPMHVFGPATLGRFLDKARERFAAASTIRRRSWCPARRCREHRPWSSCRAIEGADDAADSISCRGVGNSGCGALDFAAIFCHSYARNVAGRSRSGGGFRSPFEPISKSFAERMDCRRLTLLVVLGAAGIRTLVATLAVHACTPTTRSSCP